jgi:hypothetical protein
MIKNYNLSSIKKNNKIDSIPYRINIIKELMDGTQLETMVDYDMHDTEYYEKPDKYFDIDEDQSKNTRQVLNKKVLNFYKIINQIGGKLDYKKSGSTGHAFKGIIKTDDNEEITYGIKVVAYPKKKKYGSITNITRPENAELMMIRLLSYFVTNHHTPHIILPIASFYTSIEPFVTLLDDSIEKETNPKIKKKYSKYLEFVEKYKNDTYHKHVSILICEWANKKDFLEFVREDYTFSVENNRSNLSSLDWKVFFFQIISVLAHIQDKYPAFRHNDLKANNILVHETKRNKGSRFKYTINQHEYYVPNIGYQLKLWDFDFACIPGIVENKKVNTKWTDAINIKPKQNRYYDMHYFFNTFIRKGFFHQFLISEHIPEEAREFVARIIPRKFRNGKYVHERGRILVNYEYKIPIEVLQNDVYFEEFRNGTYKKKKK